MELDRGTQHTAASLSQTGQYMLLSLAGSHWRLNDASAEPSKTVRLSQSFVESRAVRRQP